MDGEFNDYTQKKYAWIGLFLTFGLAALLFGILLVIWRAPWMKAALIGSVLLFMVSVIQLIKYEPKRYFSEMGDRDKLLKSLEMGKKYALDLQNSKARGGHRLMDEILFQEIAYANEFYFNKMDKMYSDNLHQQEHQPAKRLVKLAKEFYAEHITGLAYSPQAYIAFVEQFESAYHAVWEADSQEQAVKTVGAYQAALLGFTIESGGKKTIVQVLGNNWHNIVLVVVVALFMVSLLDITFEMGFKLDRYLAVGSAIPTLYLLKNYNPFDKL